MPKNQFKNNGQYHPGKQQKINRNMDSPLQGKKHKFKKKMLKEPSWIDIVCNPKNSLKKQTDLIVTRIEAQPDFFKKVSRITADLTAHLRQNLNQEISVQPFGSAVCKLALKNSDVDLFLDFKGNIPDNALKVLKRTIGKSRMFKRVIGIPARVPIIQCIHNTNIMCDIAFSNSIGVHNSNLIHYLLKLDSRLRPMLLILKYLIKNSPLIPDKVITSFTVTVLLIFFVQQLETPILPPISHLQKSAETKVMIDGWNTGYSTDPSILPKVENDRSILELLESFFRFYAVFDFEFYVISSYMGKAYLKPVFDNVDMLPDEYACYKEKLGSNVECKFDSGKLVCVQGPFNHGNNITRNVGLKHLLQFRAFCRSCSNVTSDPPQGLGFNRILKSSYKNQSQLMNSENGVIFVGPQMDLRNSNMYTEEDLVNYWYRGVIDRLNEMLTRILKCVVTIYTKDEYPDENKEHVTEDTIALVHCQLEKVGLTKAARNEAKDTFDFPKNMCPVLKEEAISNYLLDNHGAALTEETMNFLIRCTSLRQPVRLKLKCITLEKTLPTKRLCAVVDLFNYLETNFFKLLQSVI